ncbi:DeoR/GlpR family DNA-binding transcription regulator, partial [Sutterella wadsworthensis]
MLKKERHNIIIELLEEEKFLLVKDIASKLNVSGMTIRRDINELANQDKVIKLYGGVQIKENEDNFRVRTMYEKMKSNIEEKKKMGIIMNNLISDNSTIYLGAGTSMLFGAKELNKKNITIVTNSILSFNYLQENTEYKLV